MCRNTSIVWLHHLDLNEALGVKPRWKLHKNAACCFEQILEAALQKQQLYGHLPPISQTV